MKKQLGLRGSLPPPAPLGHALRQLTCWATASAAAGCGDPFEGRTPVSCDVVDNVLHGARFAREVDYFAFWEDHRTEPPDGEQTVESYERTAVGAPCKSATDLTACTSMFEAASAARELCRSEGRCGLFAVASAGDRVTQIEERAELLSWLAPIENLSDALAISTWDGKRIICASQGEIATRYYQTVDRLVFGTRWRECYREKLDVWEVSLDGWTSRTIVEDLGEAGPCGIGRRPEGLSPVERRFARGTLAAHFAESAHLEAASVFAFERLARQLTRFGAPASLIARAASSALDETRHAALMGALAKRFGAEPYHVRLSNLPTRGLYQLALENAVEGCVHETFGALLAHHQAARAHDPQLRSTMRMIARDETRHAELARQVAAWALPQLSAAQRSELERAQALAWFALEQAHSQHVLAPAAARAIGLPMPEIAQGLVQQLKRMASRCDSC